MTRAPDDDRPAVPSALRITRVPDVRLDGVRAPGASTLRPVRVATPPTA